MLFYRLIITLSLCVSLNIAAVPAAHAKKRASPTRRVTTLAPQEANPEKIAPKLLVNASALRVSLTRSTSSSSGRLRFTLRMINTGKQSLPLIFHFSKSPVEITVRDAEHRVVWRTVRSRTATTGRYYIQRIDGRETIQRHFTWDYTVRYQTDTGETIRRRRVSSGRYTITAHMLLDGTYYVRDQAWSRKTMPTLSVQVK